MPKSAASQEFVLNLMHQVFSDFCGADDRAKTSRSWDATGSKVGRRELLALSLTHLSRQPKLFIFLVPSMILFFENDRVS